MASRIASPSARISEKVSMIIPLTMAVITSKMKKLYTTYAARALVIIFSRQASGIRHQASGIRHQASGISQQSSIVSHE